VRLTNAVNATLYDKLNFNFIRGIAPVSSLILTPGVMEGGTRPSPQKPLPSSSPTRRPIPVRSTWRHPGPGSSPDVYGALSKLAGVNLVPNLIGNGVATVVVSRWENAVDVEKMNRHLNLETEVEAEEPELLVA
jgi:hypothetical protein